MTLESYPLARVPLRPVLARTELSVNPSRREFPSVMQAGDIAMVTSGRVAVALALKELKLGPGSEVLIPAFHCSSMVEPVVWVGALPVFFRITPDGAVDLDDIKRKLRPNTRALLAAHYFGFPQDMPRIRQFCDEHGIALIEDCAHAFFGSVGGKPVGSYGDYACASPWKFLAAYDGGCLISARHSLENLRLASAGWRYEFKSVVYSLERSFEYDRLPLVHTMLKLPLRAKDVLRRWMKRQRANPAAEDVGPNALEGGFGFEPGWVDKRMSVASKLILKMMPAESIASARARNYNALLGELAGISGGQAFYTQLPSGVVPHMFPFLIDSPDIALPELRKRRVPMLRFGEILWEGVDERVCANSVKFSRQLVQFPCHQGLSIEDIRLLAGQVRDALRVSTRRT